MAIDSGALYIYSPPGNMLRKINSFLEDSLRGVNLNFNPGYVGGRFSCSHEFYDTMNFFYLPTGHAVMGGQGKTGGIRVEVTGSRESKPGVTDIIEKIKDSVADCIPAEEMSFPVDTSARM